MNAELYVFNQPLCFIEETGTISTVVKSQSFSSDSFIFDIHLILVMSVGYFFGSFHMYGVVSGQFCCTDRSCEEVSARPPTRKIEVIGSEDIVLALATTTLLDFSFAAQIERASLPCSAQVSSKLVAFNNVLGQ